MKPQESRFSAERLLEIAQAEYPHLSRQLQHKLVERCTVYSVQSTHELTKTLSSIDEVCAYFLCSHSKFLPCANQTHGPNLSHAGRALGAHRILALTACVHCFVCLLSLLKSTLAVVLTLNSSEMAGGDREERQDNHRGLCGLSSTPRVQRSSSRLSTS